MATMLCDEMSFFDRSPQLLPIYEILKARIRDMHPESGIKVAKTQISFSNRYIFALVSIPRRRIQGGPKEYLMISFGLSYRKESPRIIQAVEAYPNRWTHHLIATKSADVDDELLSWIEEAYQFAAVK